MSDAPEAASDTTGAPAPPPSQSFHDRIARLEKLGAHLASRFNIRLDDDAAPALIEGPVPEVTEETDVSAAEG